MIAKHPHFERAVDKRSRWVRLQDADAVAPRRERRRGLAERAPSSAPFRSRDTILCSRREAGPPASVRLLLPAPLKIDLASVDRRFGMSRTKISALYAPALP